ncbi:ATP-dependent DNA helicase DinG [Vibrio coralliirubri]|uniref:ATP-dependent DNA helicase DinG n=1 Tax=Vibrio coralliirubri TaxID=1516159 RepID=UPI00228362D5|nr:ATP-dependent DNA helicase DinG [Vibrio coralliirubri]MCY9861553.1 ATP-dependent DNA helicase DinG [Vibrio coralliirubri]
MLNAVIDQIKQTQENLATMFEGYAPREQQRRMIFEIAKAGVNPKGGIVVCEAGTGVGKSLGYLMSAVPAALKMKKKVIISTATIALQEQLINKDLPLFKKAFPESFTYQLAKGRSNYVCEHSLIDLINEVESFGGFKGLKADSELHIIADLFDALQEGSWNGERASYHKQIPDSQWDKMKSDSHRCTKKEHNKCPFHQARDALSNCDVIVANHALVISDLSIQSGGGVILPEAKEAIYIFDEAHHLPKIARESASGHYSLSGSMELFGSINKSIDRFLKIAIHNENYEKTVEPANQTREIMDSLLQTFQDYAQHYQHNSQLFDEDGQFLIRQLSQHEEMWQKDIQTTSNAAMCNLRKIINRINKKIEDDAFDSTDEKKFAQQMVSDCAFYESRIENILGVADLFLNQDQTLLVAKWATHVNGKGFTIHASPVDSARTLRELLWEHAENVVLTSATLAALGNFELFKMEAGVPQGANAFMLGSPFDYPNVAELYLPSNIKISPKNQDMFTKFLQREMFRDFIEGQKATLVLFSSYWQMREVKAELIKICDKQGYKLQCQGDAPKEKILENHREYVKNGIPSILMGTGSFSEGLDLPRDLLVNVIITKIPFGTPTDPVSIIYAEDLESRGRNSFVEISLPDASRQLIQAAGRLIRTVEDSGRVIILDNRMSTARYASKLLKALPPFKVIRGNPIKQGLDK